MGLYSYCVSEAPFFFELGTERLFGVLHRPESSSPRRGIVLCHALAEEKLWSHRVYVNLARDLAALGMAVLRFDYRGEGDSDSEFEDSGMASRVEDARQAGRILLERQPGLPGVVFLGHRLGAAVAAAAAAGPGVPAVGLVAWDPIPSGRAYLMQLLRTALASELARRGAAPTRAALIETLEAGQTVFVGGYGIGPGFYRELIETEWPQLLEAVRCPALTIEGASEPPFWRDSGRLYRRAAGMTARTVQWLGAQAA